MILSIIIPAYNAENSIVECIESIEKNIVESTSDYEIVVVDDGSTDRQNEKIQDLQRKYNNIFLYAQKNTGGLGARLYGFTKAQGEWCTCVDADDFVSDDYISTIISLVRDNSDIDYFMLNNYRDDEARNVFSREREVRESETSNRDWIVSNIVWGYEGAIWNKIFKTKKAADLYEQMQRYRNVIYSDDRLLNVAYVSLNSGISRAKTKDVAIYYHRREYGVTGGGVDSVRQFNDLQVCFSFYYDKFHELNLNEKTKTKIVYFYCRCLASAIRKKDKELIRNNLKVSTLELLSDLIRTIKPMSAMDCVNYCYLKAILLLKNNIRDS